MSTKKSLQVCLLSCLLVLFVTSGAACSSTPSQSLLDRAKPFNLNYWRVTDQPDDFGEIVTRFKVFYPNINITVQNIRAEEYKNALLEAWAEDRGPDIFSIPVSQLHEYKTKISPLPSEVTTVKTTIKKSFLSTEAQLSEEKISSPSLRALRESYIETVPNDIIIDNQIQGLPLSMDSLVLYYNRDILNNAHIAVPPTTWDQFIEDAKLTTLVDKERNFIQNGAALGTANNLGYSTDLLSLLMLQNGTVMETGARATFDQAAVNDPSYYPGQEALKFYTDFANPGSDRYTWNAKMSSAFQIFIEGRLAFYFGYIDDLKKIKESAPKLNFDIVPVPQLSGSPRQINYGNYWLETVSKKTKYPNEAWAFLLFATQPDNNATFLERAKRPTALRSLVDKQLNDYDLAAFAKSVLTSKTWYHGRNYESVDKTFKEMIRAIENQTMDYAAALKYGEEKVNLTY
jgi:ABC-type glycerol-3-phosphate transport system substrate-binding protein